MGPAKICGLLFVAGFVASVAACTNSDDVTPTGTTDTTSVVGDLSLAARISDSVLLGDLSPEELESAEFYRDRLNWQTNFSRRTVPLDDLVRGCSGMDCICAIGNNDSDGCNSDPPAFSSIRGSLGYLELADPVVAINIDGDARAYPLTVLTRHEIVNDRIGELPIAITYCPLCNSALVFARIAPDGQELDFGVSGFLVNSDLVMWDRQTQSLWQQFTGIGIAGEHAGAQLNVLPSLVISLEQFLNSYPDGVVLRGPLPNVVYTSRPYAGYEESVPFLFSGELDSRLRATSRVLGLTVEGTSVAYAWSGLMRDPVRHDTVNGREIVLFYDPDTLSTFDAQMNRPDSRNVSGSAAAFLPQVDGRQLTFRLQDDNIVDDQTGSTWSFSGVALAGELEGSELEIVPSGNHFWFAWVAFNPETEIRGV